LDFNYIQNTELNYIITQLDRRHNLDCHHNLDRRHNLEERKFGRENLKEKIWKRKFGVVHSESLWREFNLEVNSVTSSLEEFIHYGENSVWRSTHIYTVTSSSNLNLCALTYIGGYDQFFKFESQCMPWRYIGGG